MEIGALWSPKQQQFRPSTSFVYPAIRLVKSPYSHSLYQPDANSNTKFSGLDDFNICTSLSRNMNGLSLSSTPYSTYSTFL